MSVQTQIDRISGNVTAALAALTEKGVTVPAGSNSDALAGLIAAIEAGGGEDIAVVSGSFTPTEQIISNKAPDYVGCFTVQHDAGWVPRILIAYTNKYADSNLTLYVSASVGGRYNTIHTVHKYYSTAYQASVASRFVSTNNWNETVAALAYPGTSIMLAAGTTVNWMVIK